MPELAEVHKYSKDINNWANGRTFSRIVVNSSNLNRHPHVPFNGSFTIRSETRGKEQRLILKSSMSGQETSLIFNHGLVGGWAWCRAHEHDNSLIKFESEDGMSLRFVDQQRLASWRAEANWGDKRGPDPLTDHERFRENVLNNVRRSKVFTKPIAEVMLDQEFFNGIGNYLRAEILHRACIDPFMSAISLFTAGTGGDLSFGDQKQYKKSDLLLALCRAIPQEVLDRGLNKYGTREEKAAFHDWLRCYDKAECEKNHGGRKIWFVRGNAKNEPTEEDKKYLVSPSSSSSVSFPSPSFSFPSSSSSSVASFFSLPSAAPQQQQQQQQAQPLTTTASAKTGSSQLTKQLVLLSLLYKGSKIGSNDKKTLKLIAFERDGRHTSLKEALSAALECFEADQDFEEAADTLQRICARYRAM